MIKARGPLPDAHREAVQLGCKAAWLKRKMKQSLAYRTGFEDGYEQAYTDMFEWMEAEHPEAFKALIG